MNDKKSKKVMRVLIPKTRDLRGNADAYDFDRYLLNNLPIGAYYLRYACACEFPDGKFDELTQGDKSIVLKVAASPPGMIIKNVFISRAPKIFSFITTGGSIGTLVQELSKPDELITIFFEGKFYYPSIVPFPSVEPVKSCV